jgi:hypothetical protein
MPLYVYGLMRARDAPAACRKVKAGGSGLSAVEHEHVAALVSSISEDDLKLRRETLRAHTDVLQAAFRHGPVLPLRFGTALADEEAVKRDLLAPRAEHFRARLDALEEKAEMQVKATYLEEPLLRSILSEDPELARSAQRVRELPSDASHFERIRLGEGIAAVIGKRRETDAQELFDALRPLALAVVVGELQLERSVFNGAFLVEAGRLQEFDATVERLSRERADRMQFKLIGPMPAHSFADREWEGETVAASTRS